MSHPNQRKPMFFFFKRPNVNVDAFIEERYVAVYENAPIDYSVNHYPNWWRNLKKQGPLRGTENNAKSCVGILELYKRSLTLPMWSDMELNVQSGAWRFADGKSELSVHGPQQRQGFKKDYIHFKLNSPWLMKSDKNVYFSWIGDYYNQGELPIEVPPAIVDYYYQSSTNFNFFLNKNVENIQIQFNTPLAIIVPMTDKEVVIKRHLISGREFNLIHQKTSSVTFSRKYYALKKIEEKRETKKCPFGFGK